MYSLIYDIMINFICEWIFYLWNNIIFRNFSDDDIEIMWFVYDEDKCYYFILDYLIILYIDYLLEEVVLF